MKTTAPENASDEEIAQHMHRLLDELRWMYDHGVKIHLRPSKGGWNLKFSVLAPSVCSVGNNPEPEKNQTLAAQSTEPPRAGRALAVHEGTEPESTEHRPGNRAS